MNKLVFAALFAGLLLAGCVTESKPVATPEPAVAALTPAPTPTPAPKPECADADGGREYLKRGLVTDGGQVLEDYCLDENTLVEFYCFAGSSAKEDVKCENGCTQGACNEKPAPKDPLNFTLLASPSDAFINSCTSPNVVLNVVNAPARAQVRFFVNWNSTILTGSFNPTQSEANREGFAETRVATSAGCANHGTTIATFTAQVCDAASGRCANKSFLMPFTAGDCYQNQCGRNASIAD